MHLRCSRSVCIFLLTVTPAVASRVALAANILWDGTGTSWNVPSAWSLFSNATTPNPPAQPGASDTAIFNIETVNTPQTVNLNAAQSALGFAFNSTGPVTIQTGTGTNTLTLGGGGITVNPGAGVNTITSSLSLSTPQSWVNNSNSTLTIGSVTLGGHALTVDGSGNTTINGGSNSMTLDFIKNGAGTLMLNGVNSNAGTNDVLINAGTIAIGSSGPLLGFFSSDVTFGAGSTGTLSLNGHDVQLKLLATDVVVGSPVVQNGNATPATLQVGRFLSPFTYAGVLQDGAGGGSLGLRVQDGSVALSGNNTYTGLTEVNNTLTLESANALGSSVSGTVIGSSGILDLRGLAIVGESLTAKDGSQLRNSSPFAASWAGNVALEASASLSNFTVQGIGDVALSGEIISSQSGLEILKAGPNVLELSGATNNAVALLVTDGVVRLAKASSPTVHAIAFNSKINGGTLQLAGTGGDQIIGTMFADGGSFDMNGRSEAFTALALRGVGEGGSGALINSASGDSVLTMTSAIEIIEFVRISVPQSGASLTTASAMEGSGDLQKVGMGTLILNGSSGSFSGDVIHSAGTIALGSNTALGTGPLTLDSGTLRSEGAARTISNVVTIGTSATIAGSFDLTLTGAISGTGNLAKSGSGRLTLSAVSNYSGTPTVNAGTLAVNGSIAGNLTVNSGGTLAGIGTIGGMVTLNSGATLTPGNSAGEITIGVLTVSSGGMLAIEIGGTSPSTQHDQLNVLGNLALDGALDVALVNSFTPAAGNSFDILDWMSLAGTFSSLNLPVLGAGLAWNTSQLYTNGVLSVASAGVPGDYNNNGSVDAADYVLWRKGGPLLNEVDAPGTVNASDYAAWRARYGNTSSPGVGSETNGSAGAVPEPNLLLISAFGCLVGALRRCRIICT